MGKYIKELKYILKHKIYVFKECKDRAKVLYKQRRINTAFKLLMHGITHDLSKLRPSEFILFAKKEELGKVAQIHYSRNDHHPENWKVDDREDMLKIMKFVCDLKAMGKNFGNSAQEFYLKNYYKWNTINDNRLLRFNVEIELDLITHYEGPICECNTEYWSTLEELIDQGYTGDTLKGLLQTIYDRYDLDIYRLISDQRQSGGDK